MGNCLPKPQGATDTQAPTDSGKQQAQEKKPSSKASSAASAAAAGGGEAQVEEKAGEAKGAHEEVGPDGLTAGQRAQWALYDKNDKNIPLGLRTDFGYPRDFLDHYKLQKELGHGQFGTTYLSIQKSTGHKVAVKTIQKKTIKLPIAADDVRREVKILKLLSGHPNVVQFIDAFEDVEQVYICMELCEGGELLDRILSKKDNRYSEKDAAHVVRQMLNVVARCHLNGVVHRDLKPENFLFKSAGDDSLLAAVDFGLSDFRKPGKHFTDVVGSAYYVAPEVLKRRSGPESDVWSIGVITYILLTGRRPFWDKTEAGIFNEVLKKRPDFKSPPWPNISNSAKDFVKKLLRKDPRARPTAAQALSHPWVREGGNAPDIPLDIAILSNMREFVKFSRLKQIAVGALAATLDEHELQQMRDQFNAMDINKDGTITLDEIRIALNKDVPNSVKESRVVQILKAMDTNCDGIIDFEEFVAATLHVQQLEDADSDKWEERSKQAFRQFDKDGDGFIDAEELRIAAQVKFPIQNLIAEGDADGDGRISFQEFKKLLRTTSINSRTNKNYSGALSVPTSGEFTNVSLSGRSGDLRKVAE